MTFDFDKGRLKLFPLGYTQKQVDVINALVGEANRQCNILKNQLAYILATTYHECYNWNDPHSRMTQLVEMGGEKYLRGKRYYPYYGRGPSHLTWEENYRKEGERMGINLLAKPELMLNLRYGANSHVYGMKHGIFTGKKLSDYLTSTKTDFQGARKIINGIDKAALIAGYAFEFQKCIV